MIEELITRVFAVRDHASIEHWKTGSFSAHSALGTFYDEVPDYLDTIVELHQGIFDLVQVKKTDGQKFDHDIIKHMESDLEWISDNRKKITNGIPAIDNKLQELEGFYMQTLYKLTRLK